LIKGGEKYEEIMQANQRGAFVGRISQRFAAG